MINSTDLIDQQEVNVAQVQQAINNYKKTPSDRKTADHIKKKEAEIDALWHKFCQVDQQIRNDTSLPEEHPYFKRDLYSVIGNKYNEIKDRIEKELQTLKPKPSAKTETPESKSSESSVPTSCTKQAVSTLGQTQAMGPCDGTPTMAHDILRQRKIIENIQRMILQTTTDSIQRSTQYYVIKLRTIEQHWKNAQALHEKLWTSTTDSGYFDLEEYLTIEEEINNGILHLQERIAMTPKVEARAHEDLNETTNFKLPKIELPTFDGNYLNWRHFHDLFSELVDKRPLPLCQKLLYLKSSLSGEAAGLIKHFATIAINYDTAWETLKERYENKRVLVNTVIKKLLCQPASTTENVEMIKQLHDVTRECLLSLQNLGLAIDSWDPMLMYILIQRLSKTTHALWQQSLRKPKELPSLNEFLDFLKTRFQSLEALGARTVKETNQGNSQLRVLRTTISTRSQCDVCQRDHPLYACSTFLRLTPRDSVAAVQKAKRCVNCLNVGHTNTNCSSSTCNKSQKTHNSLLNFDSRDKEPLTTHKNSAKTKHYQVQK